MEASRKNSQVKGKNIQPAKSQLQEAVVHQLYNAIPDILSPAIRTTIDN